MSNSLWPWGLYYTKFLCLPPSSTIFQSLLKFMSIESVMLSNHLILCCSLLLLLSVFTSIRVFSNESALHIRWPKDWSFNISPTNEYSGLISFLVWCCCSPRDSQESSPAPQFESVNSSALSFLYGPKLTCIHDYWKNQSFDYTNLCWKSDAKY